MGNIINLAKQILKPTKIKLTLFMLFAFIWTAGVIQTYVFVDDVPDLEKPPLYDVLRPFDFWSAWIYLSTPFYLLASLMCLPYDFCSTLFSYFPAMGHTKFPIAGILYCYLASSFMGFSWSRYVNNNKRKKLILLITLIPTAVLTSPSLVIIFLKPENTTFILSTYATTYLVTLFYTITIYGIYRIVREYTLLQSIP